jgi:hypothetical protein
MQTAYTTEIDEVEEAVEAILGQLDLDALKKHSAGILNVCYDFVESGIVRALCARLPFAVIGMTTMASACKTGSGRYGLCLTVLTSDVVTFTTACTPSLTHDNYEEAIRSTYNAARDTLPGDPAFIVSFIPYMRDVNGAELVNSFSASCHDVPVWGSMTIGMDMSFEQCRTIRNEEAEQFALAMLLVYGPVEPEFIVTSIPERNIRENRGMITESDGYTVKAVNGMPILSYLDSIGITLFDSIGITLHISVPLMVYYEGASRPVALGIFTIDDEGNALCGGYVPEGALVAVGAIDPKGIMETAKESVARLSRGGKKDGILMFPCGSRYFMLAPNQDNEIRCVSAMLGDDVPYMLGYSGGEVCPVRDADGKWRNCFHNYTFSACTF